MAQNNHLLSIGEEAVEPLTTAFSNLSDQIDQLTEIADARLTRRLTALKTRMEEFTSNITLVGQIKAGKSSLVNILAGQPALLPSDVNPWTSVVTTLHINTRAPGDTKAKFTFFDQEEWDNLLQGGGRLGEMASRAGSHSEAEEIQNQLRAMKQKSEDRLGKHFELILGQSHQYDYFDRPLVERYVCLGDDADPDIDPKTGQFADVTKSAELFLDVPQYPVALTLCDTPGVNDTFLVREQITLRNLRGTDVCVVVLAASQALTTMDMALMRIIAQFENRQIVLFVNRIDELEDPVTQVPEIRDRVAETLEAHGMDADCQVVFGSAKWAEAAMTGNPDVLHGRSSRALDEFYKAAGFAPDGDALYKIWALSGMPDLLEAIHERIAEGSGARLVDRIRIGARNVANQIRATSAAKANTDMTRVAEGFEGVPPEEAIDKIVENYEGKVSELTGQLREQLLARLTSAETSFVKRATDTLVAHLEKNGEQGTWKYDPAGLRTLQKAAYFSFARNMRKQVGDLYARATADVQGVYAKILGEQMGEFTVEAPSVPSVPPPLGIGKTIALDLQSTWWRRWWQRRRGFEAYAADYARLISSEAQEITKEIEENQVAAVLENARAGLADFLKEQRETLLKIMENGQGDASVAPKNIEGLAAVHRSREEIVTDILKNLSGEAA